MGMTSDSDRRAHDRIPLRMLVQFKLRDREQFLHDYADNISSGGMFVRTTDAHPVGSMVYLQFFVEGGEKLIEGLGRVVHVNPQEHAVPGMGIEFVNLDDASQEVIDQIVSERVKELDEVP
jgi:uncharacterized protein (TIGR02266 family)